MAATVKNRQAQKPAVEHNPVAIQVLARRRRKLTGVEHHRPDNSQWAQRWRYLFACGWLVFLAATAGAEPYVALRGGAQSWGDTSNHDELESGTEWGGAFAMAVGDEAGLSDIGLPKSDFALDIELESVWRREALHGRNNGKDHRSADGENLDIGSLTANLWPGWQVTRRWTLSAGGGIGLAHAQALGHEEYAPLYQAGACARWNYTPEVSFDVCERSVWVGEARLNGYDLRYDSHGFLAGARYEFK